MKYLAIFIIAAISVTVSAAQENAQKQARKITAMATDKTGRSLVSMSIADTLKMPRTDLMEERHTMALDYGSFFVAHELIAGGVQRNDLQSELRTGKTVWQIGNERNADWNRIAADAKKQNAKIDDYIYRHFLNKKNYDADVQRDLLDKYDPARDSVRTDFAVSPKEMLDAQAAYVFWRDLGGKARGSGGRMALSDEMAARFDHADSSHSTSGSVGAPAAGGMPPR